MCLALTFNYKDQFYFGRNLDLDYHFGELPIVVPRRHVINFKFLPNITLDTALIGIGTVVDGYPLYAEAMNESGLCIAGLNYFPNAYYFPNTTKDNTNLAPYELILYLLGNAKTVSEAKALLTNIRLVAEPFKENMPLSYLHFLLADKTSSIVIEPNEDGIKIYDNPYGILTNNPSFPFHLDNIKMYGNISPEFHVNSFTTLNNLDSFCVGLPARGLPGDPSSPSRFVRATYLKSQLLKFDLSKANIVKELFHIFYAMSLTNGMCKASSGNFEITIYTSLFDVNNMKFYYSTYEELEIKEIDFKKYLETENITTFPL